MTARHAPSSKSLRREGAGEEQEGEKDHKVAEKSSLRRWKRRGE